MDSTTWHDSFHIVLKYLEVQADRPETRAWFVRFRSAITYVETAGEVVALEQYGTAPPFCSACDDICKSMLCGEVAAVNKAALSPVKIIESLELTVVDRSTPFYVRLYAWYKLVRVWTVSRGNDLEGVCSKDVRWAGDALELDVSQSKTTRPGKKIEKYTVVVGTKGTSGSLTG